MAEADKVLVQQYSDNFMMLAQQTGSRLMDKVQLETFQAENLYIDQYGSLEMYEDNVRSSDTQYSEMPFGRRQLASRLFRNTVPVDSFDKVRMLKDPSSSVVSAQQAAAKRKMDKVIIDAAFADAKTGKTGETTVAFPATQQVAVNDWTYGVGTGNAGLTVPKIIAAATILNGNEVDEEEPRFLVCSAKQLANMLATTEATSEDYNSVKALVDGKINNFLGFNFIRSEQLNTDANSYRRVIAYAKSGLALGVAQNIKARISENPNKNYQWQAFIELMIGATRLEEKKVVEIKCLEA